MIVIMSEFSSVFLKIAINLLYNDLKIKLIQNVIWKGGILDCKCNISKGGKDNSFAVGALLPRLRRPCSKQNTQVYQTMHLENVTLRDPVYSSSVENGIYSYTVLFHVHLSTYSAP